MMKTWALRGRCPPCGRESRSTLLCLYSISTLGAFYLTTAITVALSAYKINPFC